MPEAESSHLDIQQDKSGARNELLYANAVFYFGGKRRGVDEFYLAYIQVNLFTLNLAVVVDERRGYGGGERHYRGGWALRGVWRDRGRYSRRGGCCRVMK